MQKMKMLFLGRKSQLELWFQSLHFNSLDFIRFTSFFVVGFLLGLFFKRWSKYIILVAISLSIVLGVLQGFSIITVNFSTVQKLTGLQGITNINSTVLAFVQIAQKYTWEFGCSGMGFIIGFKTG